MKTTRRGFLLDSGREIYANGHILGLSLASERTDSLFEGYDGTVQWIGWENEPVVDGGGPPLTPEECREIARAMMQRWAEWAGIAWEEHP